MCVCVSFGCENFSQVISVSEWYIYIYMWSFQQGWPFIFSLPLQRGNREGTCLKTYGVGLDWPTCPAFITPTRSACSAQSDLWGVGGQRDCPQLHKSACFLLMVTKGEARRASRLDKASLCDWTWPWPSAAAFVTLLVTASQAGFLSAPFGEGLLIHPRENGRFICIDIINEEAGSMLHQLTLQGKGKWAFFGHLVPKLKTGTHSK